MYFKHNLLKTFAFYVVAILIRFFLILLGIANPAKNGFTIHYNLFDFLAWR